MQWKKLSPYILTFFVLITAVYARTRFPTGELRNVMNVLGDIYNQAPYLVDALVLLIIFVPLARKILGERLGKVPATGLGFLLVLSVIVSEAKFDYSIIRDFSIPAVIILLSMFGISLFVMLKQFDANTWLAVSAGWVAVVVVSYFAVPDVVEMIQRDYEVIWWFLVVLTGFFILAFVVSMFFGGGGGGSHHAPPPAAAEPGH
jgi:hypothetical protein